MKDTYKPLILELKNSIEKTQRFEKFFAELDRFLRDYFEIVDNNPRVKDMKDESVRTRLRRLREVYLNCQN